MAKIYTAILNIDGQTIAIDVNVTSNREEARLEVEQKYPGHELIALVPGQHASWTKVYQSDEHARARRKVENIGGSIKDIDIWALPNELPTE